MNFSMDIYRVAFIGHRWVDDVRGIQERLTEKIVELIRTKYFVEFQLGRSGEFDEIAASCVKRAQKTCGNENSSLTLVLPYPVADLPYYEEYYDNIFIPEEAERAHCKAAITKRNQWLVDNSDLLIAFVEKETGGAAACLKMAQKAGIEIYRI